MNGLNPKSMDSKGYVSFFFVPAFMVRVGIQAGSPTPSSPENDSVPGVGAASTGTTEDAGAEESPIDIGMAGFGSRESVSFGPLISWGERVLECH